VAQITVTVTGHAPVIVTVTQDGTVGISESTLNDLRAYPNPSTGLFTIGSKTNGIADVEVTILDLSGRTILAQQCSGQAEYHFDLSQKPEGIYFVRMKSSGSMRVERMIIRK